MSGAGEQRVIIFNSDGLPISSGNPLYVTPVSGGVDQDVNIAAVGGTATVTGGVNGLLGVAGNAASAATDAGNPVKVGGVYNAAPPTYTDGQRTNLQTDTRGNVRAVLFGNNTQSAIGGSFAITDTQSNTVTALYTVGQNLLYDGTDWGRHRTPDSTIGTAYVENGPYTASRVTADGQVKATAGFIHTVTFSPTGAVTAGVITIYNSAAESGTIVFSCALPVTTFTPFSVVLDVACGTGIYVGYDGTVANVQTTVSFR